MPTSKSDRKSVDNGAISHSANMSPTLSPALVMLGIIVSFLCGCLWSTFSPVLWQYSAALQSPATVTSSVTRECGADGSPCDGALQGHMERLGTHSQPSVEIPILDTVPNPEEFYDRYIRQRQPVLLRGAAKSMPAFTRWKSKDYLKENFGETLLKVEMRKIYDTEEFEKRVMTLSDFLDRYEKENLYMDSPVAHSPMLNDVLLPMCMECPQLRDSVVSSHLLFSNGNTSSSFHFDGVDNLLVLLAGRKQFVVIGNEYLHHSYFDEHTSFSVISPINPEAVDLVKFPQFKQVEFGIVNIEPGDIFYSPSLQPHHVRSFDGPNIAVNIWFEMFGFADDVVKKQFRSSEDKSVVKYHTALHKAILENAPQALVCNEERRRLYTALQNSSNAELDHPPSDKANASLAPFVLNSGYKMPRLGFGSPRLSGKEAEKVFAEALRAGYRMFDSAQAYDEEAFGNAVQESGLPREELFIISKVSPGNFGRTGESIDESLRKLKTSYIDLMLLHAKDCHGMPGNCTKTGGPWQDGWFGLEKAVQEGKVRSIGVSNFETVSELEEVIEIATEPLSVVQNYMEPFEVPEKVLEYCSNHSIVFMGYGTLGRAYANEGMKTNPVLTSPLIKESLETRQCTAAEVVLRWALQLGTAVIPSSQNPLHMAINLHALDIQLDDHEMQIMALFQKQDPITGKFSDLAAVKAVLGDGEGGTDPNDRSGAALEDLDGVLLEKYGSIDVNRIAVYAGGDDGLFTAFNGSTGKIMWQFQTYNEFGSSCVFSPDHMHIYFASENHRVYCLDASTGDTIWSVSTSGGIVSTPQLSLNRSALLVGNLAGQFYAISRKSGRIVWDKRLATNEIWSSGTVGMVDGLEVLFVGVLERGIFALRVSDGSAVWHRDVPGGVWGAPTLSPDKGHVFFGGQDGTMYCVTTSSGDTVWSWHTAGKLSPSPCLHGSSLYGASDRGALFALDAATGVKLWKIRTGTEIISSPKLAPGGILAIGGVDGSVRGYQASTGKRLWSFRTDHEVWATAALSKSGLAVIGGVDEHMYALNASNGNLVWKTKSSPFAASPCIAPKFKN